MDREELIINKIGLDIDGTTHVEKTINRIIELNKSLKLINRANIYLSASETGLHFEIYLTRKIGISESFEIRELLGDDPKRIMFSKADFHRGWDFDILFTYKKINGVWKRRQFIEERIF